MIVLLSIGLNGILMVCVMYHLMRYGKKEFPIYIVGCAYLAVSLVCMLLLIGNGLSV